MARPEAGPSIVRRRQQHDRRSGRRGLGTEETAELETGDTGHPEVRDHGIRAVLEGELSGFGRMSYLHDVVALLAKAHAEKRARTRAVVYQEDSRHGYRLCSRAGRNKAKDLARK